MRYLCIIIAIAMPLKARSNFLYGPPLSPGGLPGWSYELQEAFRKRSEEAKKTLPEIRTQRDKIENEFIKAATEGDLAKIKDLMQQAESLRAASLTHYDNLGMVGGQAPHEYRSYAIEPNKIEMALINASQNGRLAVVEYLIGLGDIVFSDTLSYPPFTTTRVLQTPNKKEKALRAAAQNGHEDIVKYLIVQGADIDSRDENGKTALDLAQGNNHQDTVAVLISGKKIRTEKIAQEEALIGNLQKKDVTYDELLAAIKTALNSTPIDKAKLGSAVKNAFERIVKIVQNDAQLKSDSSIIQGLRKLAYRSRTKFNIDPHIQFIILPGQSTPITKKNITKQ